MTRRSRIVLMGLLGTALALSVTGVAAAQPPVKEDIYDEFSEVFQDYCDVEGLTVREEGVFQSRLQWNPRKRDRLAYFLENVRFSSTVTNVADEDRWVSIVETSVYKDLTVTDNGDGTLTVLVLATGNLVVYDQTGKAIARNPGQVRFEVLIDDGGTPQDPTDDEFLEFLGDVKGSTGRNDDFCAAVVPVLTG